MKWTDVFEIKIDSETADLDMHNIGLKYLLIEKASGRVIGSYDDHVYAEKQARHKFKRYMKKIERTLLG